MPGRKNPYQKLFDCFICKAHRAAKKAGRNHSAPHQNQKRNKNWDAVLFQEISFVLFKEKDRDKNVDEAADVSKFHRHRRNQKVHCSDKNCQDYKKISYILFFRL